MTGSWSEFEELVSTWFKNRNRRRTEPQLRYPRLQCADPQLPPDLLARFEGLLPAGSLSAAQWKELRRNLRLQKDDFELEALEALEARVNPQLTELDFPIR